MTRTVAWTRTIPEEDGIDLLVAGGGPAGCAAALAGARAGLRTVLVEQTGALGGLGTSGLVCAFDPMASGTGPLVGGVCKTIVDTMHDRGFLGPGETPEVYWHAYHHWTKFQPEGLKLVLDDLAERAGVDVRLFTRLVDVDAAPGEGRVSGVVTHDVEGFRMVRAKAFVDATGDAVLCHGAGARTADAGHDTPRIMPPTLPQLMADVDWNATGVYSEQQNALEQALKDGFFRYPTRHLPGSSAVAGSVAYLNGGHVFGVDPVSAKSLSEGMRRGRRVAREFLEFYRKYVPGYANAVTAATGVILGIRESRRVASERDLTLDDYLARRAFPDQIGRFNKFVDIHPYDDSPEEHARFRRDHEKLRLGKGEWFGLPYGMLVPKGWANLWVAGRCAGADVPMQGAVRVMPACYMMGEAAGAAAALALEDRVAAGAVDRDRLKSRLVAAGALL